MASRFTVRLDEDTQETCHPCFGSNSMVNSRMKAKARGKRVVVVVGEERVRGGDEELSNSEEKSSNVRSDAATTATEGGASAARMGLGNGEFLLGGEAVGGGGGRHVLLEN